MILFRLLFRLFFMVLMLAVAFSGFGMMYGCGRMLVDAPGIFSGFLFLIGAAGGGFIGLLGLRLAVKSF